MDACGTCGAEQHRVGVLYPARRLCRCEKRACHCERPAVVVEFQSPVRGAEPPLPSTSDTDVRFLCAKHVPSDFPPRVGDDAPGAPGIQRARLPHIDPAWKATHPPPGSSCTLKVQCVACKRVHELKERRMFNGTESQCPHCAERVSVLADEEEDPA